MPACSSCAPNWATAAITALARMGGHAVAVIANQPKSKIAGAIDADAADKLARFIQLADAFDLPIVSLMDNPGFMLGPAAEHAGIARHHARPLMAQVHRTVPLFLVHIRKAYGLGPMAMGGMFQPTDLRIAWPTVESGGMALEGAAALIQRHKQRDEGAAPSDREQRDTLAAQIREGSLALDAARRYAFDDVIDPADPRADRADARPAAAAARPHRQEALRRHVVAGRCDRARPWPLPRCRMRHGAVAALRARAVDTTTSAYPASSPGRRRWQHHLTAHVIWEDLAMAWDFSTDPDVQARLDWADRFVAEEIEPSSRCSTTWSTSVGRRGRLPPCSSSGARR